MAVVSPWFCAVLAFLNAFNGQLPCQKNLSGDFGLNLGSRLVIMALIYWDTPVLQWNGQIVAIDP